MTDTTEKRPLSQYDNLTAATSNTTTTTTANLNTNSTPFSELDFKFDTVDGGRSSYQYKKPVMSDAKSIFFGLQSNKSDTSMEDSVPLVSRSNNKSPVISTSSPVQNYTPLKANGGATTPPPHNDASSSKSVTSSNGSGKKITLLVDDTNLNIDGDSAKRLSQGYLSPSSTPSQAVYMSTTVPQNISKTNISNRHKPTRSSLRHSRMLVMSRTSQGDQYALTIGCRLLARICYTALLFSALLICLISMGILIWTPHTATKDNPYWSGIMIFLCGIIGLAVTEFKKYPVSRLKESYFTFLQINCAFLLIVTIFCCSLALIYSTFQFATLSTDNKECHSENLALGSTSCICHFGDRINATVVSPNDSDSTSNGGEINRGLISNGEIIRYLGGSGSGFEVHYRDLACTEVLGIWYYVILVLIVLNGISLVAAVVFTVIFVIGTRNRTRRVYTSVRRTSNNIEK